MNWKQEAVDKLRGYPLRRCSLDRLGEELERLEHEAARISAVETETERVSDSPAGSREDALVNNIVLREELQHARRSAALWVRQVDHALAQLDDDSRRILERLYFSRAPGSIDALCAELCMERSTLYRRREHALRQFTLSLYGALDQF